MNHFSMVYALFFFDGQLRKGFDSVNTLTCTTHVVRFKERLVDTMIVFLIELNKLNCPITEMRDIQSKEQIELWNLMNSRRRMKQLDSYGFL